MASILFVTCHLPFAGCSGGRRRELELLRRVSERFDIRLLAVTKTIDEDRLSLPLAREICREVTLLPAADLPADAGGRTAPQVLRHRTTIRRLRGFYGRSRRPRAAQVGR